MSSCDHLCEFAARLRRLFADCLEPAGSLSASDWFEGMAIELFQLQFQANPVYRSWCVSRNVAPENITSWLRIPALPVAAFKELAVTCIPLEERKHVFISSGTTGQNTSRHYHNEASLDLYSAAAWPWFASHVLPQTLRTECHEGSLLCLTPGPGEAPTSSLVHMFEVVRREMNQPHECFAGVVSKDGSWELAPPRIFRSMEAAVNSGRPLWLLGTAFSFVHLLDAMGKANFRLRLPPGSRVMETGGYKGRSRALTRQELHKTLSVRLGVPEAFILSEYGMSELSSQAYTSTEDTTGSKRLFRFPPWARVEIISPETGREVADGETGLIRVLDLANVYSALCLQTEDSGRKQKDGFEMLGRAEAAEPRGCSLMLGGTE